MLDCAVAQAPSLKQLLDSSSPDFSVELAAKTRQTKEFYEVVQLCTMRRRALAKGLLSRHAHPRRVAMIGGANLRPLMDLVEHFAEVEGGLSSVFWVGDHDNYISEVLEAEGPLYEFRLEVVLLLPFERPCVYSGPLDSSRVEQEDASRRAAQEVLDSSAAIHDRCGAEVILSNFRLPPYYDPGPMRNSSLISEYSFPKFVNAKIGLKASSFAHICDIEFVSNRRGNLAGVDDRNWFESKQPLAAALLVDVAREYAHVLSHIATAAKKVLVLDLDNTLWGGVIDNDGLEGIEIETTSPRGEAFRDFQKWVLELSKRGVLLAVCSKNDYERAIRQQPPHCDRERSCREEEAKCD